MKLGMLEGWLREDEGRALRRMARAVPRRQAIVELGAYKGKATCFLGVGAREGDRAAIWSVDLWLDPDVLKAFNRQTTRMGVRPIPVRGDSALAGHRWQGPPVGLLFVDADHSEESVREDLLAWAPQMHPGGVIALHDWRDSQPGVEKAARGILGEPTEIIGSLAVYR